MKDMKRQNRLLGVINNSLAMKIFVLNSAA
jgi:hypothetical protein